MIKQAEPATGNVAVRLLEEKKDDSSYKLLAMKFSESP
jgi:hypothetical protein